MPIYEFYCDPCNTIFNFFSRRVNTEASPPCPKCGKELKRQISLFSTVGKAKEPGDDVFAGVDESKLEQAFTELARDAENFNEEDPKQMAQMMRKLTEKTGMSLGDGMEEALARLESGEDPEKVEQEMGDVLSAQEQLFKQGMKQVKKSGAPRPFKDETLYEL